MPSERIKLVIEGSAYHNWYEAEVDSDLQLPADAWSVTAKMPDPNFVGAFREGMSCELYVGDDRQLSGLIDDVKLHGDAKRSQLALTGRDNGGWLIDDEAEALKVAKLTLGQLIKKLLKPGYHIRNVIMSNDLARKKSLGKADAKTKAGTGKKLTFSGFLTRDQQKIDPGVKVAQILDLHCSRLGITWWITPAGDLFLGQPNYDQEPAYDFRVYARGSRKVNQNNVLDWTFERSLNERFATITVGGQSQPTQGSFTDPKGVRGSKFKATADDRDLKTRGIPRTLFIADNDAKNRRDCSKRAAAEMGRRRLAAMTILLQVPGFRQDGRLYQPDTLATVKIEEAKIDGTFYVTQRRFKETRGKSRTELTLHEKGVWLA